MIEQAKSELQLIPLYASWRMWEEPAPTPQDDDFSHIYEVRLGSWPRRSACTLRSHALAHTHARHLHSHLAGDQISGRQGAGGADWHGQAGIQDGQGPGQRQAIVGAWVGEIAQ